jgi:hypothetical protein
MLRMMKTERLSIREGLIGEATIREAPIIRS